jgi:hypothetical protein
MTTMLTAPLTISECMKLASGDRFVACIIDCTTRKNRGLFPFDNKPHGKKHWSVSATELAAMAYWSRFAADGAAWPSEQDVPGRLAQGQPALAKLGIVFRHDATAAVWVFSVASAR